MQTALTSNKSVHHFVMRRGLNTNGEYGITIKEQYKSLGKEDMVSTVQSGMDL